MRKMTHWEHMAHAVLCNWDDLQTLFASGTGTHVHQDDPVHTQERGELLCLKTSLESKLKTILKALSAEEMRALDLICWKNQSWEDAAAQMGMPKSRVQTRIMGIYRKLAVCLEHAMTVSVPAVGGAPTKPAERPGPSKGSGSSADQSTPTGRKKPSTPKLRN
jgi:predicted DNA-binding protein (UPF0251 family)